MSSEKTKSEQSPKMRRARPAPDQGASAVCREYGIELIKPTKMYMTNEQLHEFISCGVATYMEYNKESQSMDSGLLSLEYKPKATA